MVGAKVVVVVVVGGKVVLLAIDGVGEKEFVANSPDGIVEVVIEGRLLKRSVLGESK